MAPDRLQLPDAQEALGDAIRTMAFTRGSQGIVSADSQAARRALVDHAASYQQFLLTRVRLRLPRFIYNRRLSMR